MVRFHPDPQVCYNILMLPLSSKKKSISVVIPLFDEEKNIQKLLNFLLCLPYFKEIICVNDGSTDNSLAILKTFNKKIKVINFKKNYGKGHALSSGIKKAKGEILLFLDADLINLTKEHLEKIIKPIMKGKVRTVLGYGTPRKNHFFCSNPMIQMITGQRAYYKEDLLPYIKQIAKTRYGVEIYLGHLIPKEKIKSVALVGLTHIWKHKKHMPHKALKQYVQMGAQVATEFGKQKIKNNIAWKGLSKTSEVLMLKEITEEIKGLTDDLINLRNPKKTFAKIKKYYEKIAGPYSSTTKKW